MISLFALLSLSDKHSLPRHTLVEQLWPEQSPDVSRNRFRVTLHHLRRLLEPLGVEAGSVLQAARADIALHPAAFTSDVNDFRAAHKAARACPEPAARISLWERAVTLYSGEFLPGWDEQWAENERMSLARLYFETLRGLTRDLMRSEEPEQSLTYARLAVEQEPLEEEAHLDLMRAYGLTGQPTEALRQYRQLSSLLARELGAKPSAATQRLASLLQAKLGHGVPAFAPAALSAPLPSIPREQTRLHQTSPDSPSHSTLPVPLFPARPALPVRLTRFFGREEESSSLCALLAPEALTRLVTLSGPGGMGKTRLALETAGRLQQEYAGRVYFVGLVDALSTRQVGDALLSALRLSPDVKTDALSQAMTAFSEAPSLLILDNLEHLLPDASDLVGRLLGDVENLHCLITSRRSVGVEGEQEIALRSLPLPAPDLDMAALREYPGIALFVDRARAARRDFALTEHNAADVLWLCRSLDGLPLALELAAARARVMSASEMRAQFGASLDWLVDGRSGKQARHRSLRAAIEWSYRLLTPRQRHCFHTLSVFAGGFTVEAAGVVCADLCAAPADVTLMLEELCEASLLTSEEDANGRMRFRMLETLRAFGQEQMGRSGEEARIRRRHLQWCAHYAETVQSVIHSQAGREEDSVHLLSAEDGNLRAALEHGMRPDADTEEQRLALVLAAALPDYWRTRGQLSEGRVWLNRALALAFKKSSNAETQTKAKGTEAKTAAKTEETSEDAAGERIREGRARARVGAARLAIQQGDYAEAQALAEEGICLAQASGDRQRVADHLCDLGSVAFRQGDYSAAGRQLEEALTAYVALQDHKQRAECLSSLGLVAWYQADHAAARARMEEALAIQRERCSRRGIAVCLLRLGSIARDKGDFAEGTALIEEALPMFHALRDRSGIANALHDLGLIALFQEDSAQGETRFREALAIYRESGARQGIAACLHNLGEILLTQERWKEGQTLTRDALAAYEQMGDRRGIAGSLHNLGVAAEGLSQFLEASELFEKALQIDREIGNPVSVAQHLNCLALLKLKQAQTQEAQDCLREALAVNQQIRAQTAMVKNIAYFVPLLQQQGQTQRAIRIAGAASALLRAVNAFYAPDEKRVQERAMRMLRQDVGEEMFAACWQEGEAMLLETALREVSTDVSIEVSTI